jgi:1-acyl-sn-glycerol-3-phosphate acyltransferase
MVPQHWRVMPTSCCSVCSAAFTSCPLYALIQQRSASTHRSRIIAANNILNALFIVASAGSRSGLLTAGLSIPQLFLVVGVMNAAVALYIYTLVPEFLMRFLAWLLVHTFYRVRAEGLENIPEDGACILVCNHVSYVDPVVISACVRRPIRFVMDHRIFRIPVLSFIFRTMRTIPIAPAKEDAALKERAFAEAAKALEAGEIVGIFPEGRLTETASSIPFDRVSSKWSRQRRYRHSNGAARLMGKLFFALDPGQGDASLARHVCQNRAGDRAGGPAGRCRPGTARSPRTDIARRRTIAEPGRGGPIDADHRNARRRDAGILARPQL